MMEAAGGAGEIRRVRSVRAVGTCAVLAELSGTQDVLALQTLLLEKPLPGQRDVLAAAETVLVRADSSVSARRIAALLPRLEFTARARTAGELVVIDTVYDGGDLAEVGELTGLGTEGVITAHSSQLWTMAFAGFAPGFGYLVGENNVLDVPRRSSPRTAVPAGSVALAGHYSAVYPRSSPGGWQLIGRTGAKMWDLDREQPALITPGHRIRFRATRDTLLLAAESPSAAGPSGKAESPSAAGPSGKAGDPAEGKAEGRTQAAGSGLRIISPGPSSLIQDLGRHGHSALGVSAAGALDRASLRRANRLVGNAPAAAAVETVAGGLRLQALGDQILAVAGAPAPLVITAQPDPGSGEDGALRTVPMAAPFALLDGEILSMGAPESGFRSYVAIRGGIDVPPVLGSRSTDTLSGIGPAPLAARGFLAAGGDIGSGVVGDPELQPDFPGTGVSVLDVVPGPRADWFGQAALDAFCGQDWEVTPQSNRVGMRLQGLPLRRVRAGELPSEGTVAGAIQVPPAGLPVLFLADHPITGGYPVIGVVVDSQLDRAAQVPIGGRIRFRWVAAENGPAAGQAK